MVRGIRDKATQAPGYGAFGNVVFNPTADIAIQKMFDVNALSDLGIRFPFNNGSTTVTNISGSTTLSPSNGVLYYDELNISGGATVDVGASPCFIFARKLTIAAGCVLHSNGRGSAGGSATTGPSLGAGGGRTNGTDGVVGNDGANSDYGNTDSTKAPQYSTGITIGAGGGGSGGGGGQAGSIGGNNTGGVGKAGGNGGRGSLFYPGSAGGSAGAAGSSAGGNGGDGGNGTAGATKHRLNILSSLIEYYRSHSGGAGGGSGAAGAVGARGADATSNPGDGGNGGAGGNGGGLLVICCETLDNRSEERRVGKEC